MKNDELLRDDIENSRKWDEDRQWMKEQNVPLDEFEEEENYKWCSEKYDFPQIKKNMEQNKINVKVKMFKLRRASRKL